MAGADYGMFNDLGVYGVPRLVRERKPWDAVSAMRKMEDFTRFTFYIFTFDTYIFILIFIKWKIYSFPQVSSFGSSL